MSRRICSLRHFCIRSFLFALLIGVVFAAFVSAGSAMAAPPLAQRLESKAVPLSLPSLIIEDAKGAPYSLAKFKGKPLVINVWATWCAPCVRELPELLQLSKKLAPEVAFLAVSIDRERAEAVEPFLKEHGLKGLPVAYDPKSMLARELKLRGVPSTLLITAEGKLTGLVSGEVEWTSDQTLAGIRKALGLKRD